MNDTKTTKKELYFSQIINAIILAGMILLITGFYYCVIKAGIPYQDPPLELQIQYAVNMGIGRLLVKNGFLISVCGGIARLLFQWLKANRRHILV